MPGRYWRAFRAAARGGLILAPTMCGGLTAAGNPTHHRPQTNIEGAYNAYSAKTGPRKAPTPPIGASSKPNEGTPRYNTAKHNNESSPKWTDNAVAVSAIGSFIFTVVLAVSTIALWRETKRLAKGAEDQHGTLQDSVVEARRAADAATIAAIAGRATVENDRAWMALEKIDKGTLHNGSVDGIPVNNIIFFIAVIQNMGRTPAIDVRFKTDYRAVNHGDQIPIFAMPTEDESQSRIIVPQNGGITVQFGMDDTQTAKFRARELDFLMYARVEYFDIFSDSRDVTKRRHTEICTLAVHGGGITVGPNGETREAIEFRHVGTQNSIS